jgi:hypothetical protein
MPAAPRFPMSATFPLAAKTPQLDNYVAKNRTSRQNSTRQNCHATKPYVDRRRRNSYVNKRIHPSRVAQLLCGGELCRQKRDFATKLAATKPHGSRRAAIPLLTIDP